MVVALFLVIPFWSLTAMAQTTISGSSSGGSGNSVTFPASKINCNPQYRAAIIQAGVNATRADAITNESIRRPILQQPPNQLMACVGSFWPSLNIGFPTMDQIEKAAEDYVVNQACQEARNAMTQVTNPITSAGGAWGSIPGLNLPSAGGGVSTGTGGSNGSCVIINGKQTCSGGWATGLNGVL